MKLLALPEDVQALLIERNLTLLHGQALLPLAAHERVCVLVAASPLRWLYVEVATMASGGQAQPQRALHLHDLAALDEGLAAAGVRVARPYDAAVCESMTAEQ